jgi:hypothetical protein
MMVSTDARAADYRRPARLRRSELPRLDAAQMLRSLEGTTIHTLTGKPNTILRISGDLVIVATTRSPEGRPVPIAWVQEALDRLVAEGEVAINVGSVGYRSAFIGAVLSTVPGVVVGHGSVRLPGSGT